MIADLQKRDQAKVMELLRSVRQKRLTVALFRIHEGKWWWVNDGELLRPLTTGELIELAKMDHPSFARLFVVAATIEQVRQFRCETGLEWGQIGSVITRKDLERLIAFRGVVTAIVLSGTPAEIESGVIAKLRWREKAIYRLEEAR